VAGNYSGTTTMVLPELGQTITCPSTTSVTQSGSTVNLAPIILNGACGGASIPLGQTTIDRTGTLFGGQKTFSFTDTCGTYNATGSGGFFGRELRISVNATSNTCYNINLTITMNRQ
jgi:hypothetical protein